MDDAPGPHKRSLVTNMAFDDYLSLPAGRVWEPNVSAAQGLPVAAPAPAIDHQPTHASPFFPRQDTLEVGKELGRGGMGMVHQAHQVSLGRQVVVKRLLPDLDQPRHRAALIREAKVTGFLSHPNIVPVHDLRIDRAGRPTLVLKKIQGVGWGEFMDDPSLLPAEAIHDPLGWHLDVLVRVTRAIEFAHAQSIIHRDLKADNVMIGSFGEVYVLDWGLAVSLQPDPPADLPTLHANPGICGTPSCMPPEMFQTKTERYGLGTDVYLLGSLLFNILSGRKQLREATHLKAYRALASQSPPMDEAWPKSLVDLMRHCFAGRQQDRPSAQGFREAIQMYLAQRGHEEILERTLANVARWHALQQDADHVTSEISDLYGQCRFGLDEVLSKLPDDQRAKQARVQLLQGMGSLELKSGRPAAAEVFLRQLGDGHVGTAIHNELRAQKRSKQRIERLARMSNQRVGWSARLATTLGIAAVAVTVMLLTHTLQLPTLVRFVVEDSLLTFFSVIAAILFRDRILSSTLNRGFAATVAMMIIGMFCVSVFGLSLEQKTEVIYSGRMLVASFSILGLALFVDLRLLPGFFVGLASVVAGMIFPAYATYTYITATLMIMAYIAVVSAWQGRRTGAKTSPKHRPLTVS